MDQAASNVIAWGPQAVAGVLAVLILYQMAGLLKSSCERCSAAHVLLREALDKFGRALDAFTRTVDGPGPRGA